MPSIVLALLSDILSTDDVKRTEEIEAATTKTVHTREQSVRRQRC